MENDPKSQSDVEVNIDLGPAPTPEIHGFVLVERADIFAKGLEKTVSSLDTLGQDLGLESATSPPCINFTGSPKITHCIRNRNRISLKALLPGYFYDLSFCPNDTEGYYRTIIKAPLSNEAGRIHKVLVCTTSDWRFPQLRCFKYRFVVTTVANDRQGTMKVWRIGFDQFTHEADVEE